MPRTYVIEPRVDHPLGHRLVVIETLWGGRSLSLNEAGELHFELGKALERALDPSPIPEPEPQRQVPSAEARAHPSIPTIDELA